MEDYRMNEKTLIKNDYKKYYGKTIDVYYSKDICKHVGNCIKGDPNIFTVNRRPWIIPDNAMPDKVERVVNTCPTGALKFIRREDENKNEN